MQNDDEKVILFPKWQTTLEEESLTALKQKKYDEALTKLNKLISYHVNNHEIMIAKLICLMELGQYNNAQDLCEDLLQEKNEHYYQYVHMYLTILFQTSQYELLMDQVEYEFETEHVPTPIKEQFQQLYDMSEKMRSQINVEKSSEYIDELLESVNKQHHEKQWRIIENMRKMKVKPDVKMMEGLLKGDSVHPVTKTAIFQWLQEKEISHNIVVQKLDSCITVTPIDVAEISSHIIMKQTLLLISELEQKNPTLFYLIEKLLYRYAYVRYPNMPPKEDFMLIAEALTNIGEQYLNLHNDSAPAEEVVHYMEEIKLCETLYLSIIEE